MNKKLTSLLSEYIPADLSLKGLAKVQPQLRTFFSAAAAAGYGANEIQRFLRGLTDQAPGRDVRQQELEQRRGKGMRQSEILELDKLQQQKAESGGINPALVGGIAGLLATRMGGTQADEEDGDQRQQTYFQRAMEGINFLDLDNAVKGNVGKLGRRLEVLEQQQVPWKDRSVQNIVRAIRKLTSPSGLVAEESERFEGQYGQQQQQPEQQQAGSDQAFIALLDEFQKRFLQ